jgi:ribosomal protein L20A (L18A)
MFLSSGQKRTAKAIARDRWNLVNREFGSKSIEERKRIAIEQVEEVSYEVDRAMG